MAPSANFVDLCRICATETQSIVRHFIFEGEGKLRDLSKKIAACLPVKVKEDDRLPKVLCGECVYKLDLLHEFREKSQKTEAYLFTLIDGPASDHHVRKQSSSQLRGAEEEDDDDSHGGGDNDGGHDIDDDEDELEPVTPAPVRRNAQGQICEPEVVIKVEEDNSKGDAAAASAASATPSAAAGTEDGGSPSKRPRRAAANKRPIREDSPSLEAPSSPPPPKRRGRKPKGVTPTSTAAATSTATPGTSTSGASCDEVEVIDDDDDESETSRSSSAADAVQFTIEPHFLLQGNTFQDNEARGRAQVEAAVAAQARQEAAEAAAAKAAAQASRQAKLAARQAAAARLAALAAEQALRHGPSSDDEERLAVTVELEQRLERTGRKSKRCKQACPDVWQSNLSKKLRMEGKPYIGRVLTKDGSVTKVIRPGKQLGPPCTSTVCSGGNFKRKCSLFTFEERKIIHKRFWRELTWEQRKMFVFAHVTVTKRAEPSDNAKKLYTMTYHLTNSKNQKLIVCKQMFKSTLSIGERTISRWSRSGSFGIPTPIRKPPTKPKTHSNEYLSVKAFLDTLPKQPCRKEGTKVYLDERFQQISDVYRSYVKHCEDNNNHPASRSTMFRVFSDNNLSLAKPRKDQARPHPARKEQTQQRPPIVTGAAEGLLALNATPTVPLVSPPQPAPPPPTSAPRPSFFPQTTPEQYNVYNAYCEYAYGNRNEVTDQQQLMQNRGFYN